LRRGYWKIEAQLDLHGYTREEARQALVVFLDASSKRGCRCVRVIHGKGLSSRDHEPVLKARVGGWLAQRADVLAFCQARPEDGGSGAVLVLLSATAR
jgi:DNA-nicking Smr family endonuclease